MRSALAIAFMFLAVLAILPTAVAETKASTTTETTEPETPPQEEPDPEAMEKAQQWVKQFIVKHAPPGRKLWYPGAEETKEEALERYDDIAKDIVETAYNPNTKSIFKSTFHGRSMMASVWMGIALHESGFMKNVDFNIGKYGRGDNGNSWCMMQLQIGKGRTVTWNRVKDRIPHWGDPPEEIFEGYLGKEIIAERQLCFQEAHKLVRRSFKRCKELPLDERLTAYAAGACAPRNNTEEEKLAIEDGKKKSRARMRSGIRYFQGTKQSRGFRDTDVVRRVDFVLAQRKLAEQEKKAAAPTTIENERMAQR